MFFCFVFHNCSSLDIALNIHYVDIILHLGQVLFKLFFSAKAGIEKGEFRTFGKIQDLTKGMPIDNID